MQPVCRDPFVEFGVPQAMGSGQNACRADQGAGAMRAIDHVDTTNGGPGSFARIDLDPVVTAYNAAC